MELMDFSNSVDNNSEYIDECWGPIEIEYPKVEYNKPISLPYFQYPEVVPHTYPYPEAIPYPLFHHICLVNQDLKTFEICEIGWSHRQPNPFKKVFKGYRNGVPFQVDPKNRYWFLLPFSRGLAKYMAANPDMHLKAGQVEITIYNTKYRLPEHKQFVFFRDYRFTNEFWYGQFFAADSRPEHYFIDGCMEGKATIDWYGDMDWFSLDFEAILPMGKQDEIEYTTNDKARR
ncbi:MAG: hypothetical protein GY928_34135 [Colwellia sp.]|nr:hypothetical protein [Colwellia sp.]